MTESEGLTFFKCKGYGKSSGLKIQHRCVETIQEDETVFDEETTYGFRVPFQNSLKYFLQVPGIFNSINKS